jgi:hypothetical protein
MFIIKKKNLKFLVIHFSNIIIMEYIIIDIKGKMYCNIKKSF